MDILLVPLLIQEQLELLMSLRTIDVAEGTIQSVGDLMIKASKSGVNYDVQRELDTALTSTNYANMADSIFPKILFKAYFF